MECVACGRHAASASERHLLPEWTTCYCMKAVLKKQKNEKIDYGKFRKKN